MSQGIPTLEFLEQEKHISHRDYLLISQFISKKDFSLESLNNIIDGKQKKIKELQSDLELINRFEKGVRNRTIERVSKLKTKTEKQKSLLKNHSIHRTLKRIEQFREVISELIIDEKAELNLLINRFIADQNQTADQLDQNVNDKLKKIKELRHDYHLINQQNPDLIDQFDPVEIRTINRLRRLDYRELSDKQKIMLEKYSIQTIMNRVDQFQWVILELILGEQIDLKNLTKIHNVYLDYLPEATLSPRSSRSELESSPTRQFSTTSPTLTPRGNSPSPRSSPNNTPRTTSLRSSSFLIRSPHRMLLRKSKSEK